MAGRGPAPKVTASRERDEKRRHAGKQTLDADGELRGPDLPEADWHPATVAWWSTWRKSAQAKLLIDTDWSFLLDTALMHNAMWSNQRWEFAAEIRLRVAKFGATLEDRQRLKLDVSTGPEAPRASLTVMQGYRRAANGG